MSGTRAAAYSQPYAPYGTAPPTYDDFQDEGIPEQAQTNSSRAQHHSPPHITSDDIVIAVMGVTGVGKSTFIAHFDPSAIAGDSLTSETVTVGIHEAWIGGRKIFLIDTPGFDDTNRSDTDVLREVADWLNRSYQAQVKLAGIIYLHRISDNRMTGAAMKNLRMFKKLCGDQGLSSVILATTMWSRPPTAKDISREQELVNKEEFWQPMIQKGSIVLRQDDGANSATRIIHSVLSRRQKVTLQIQEEMASGKTLDETAAGRVVEAEIERMRAKHEKELAELRHDMLKAQRENDKKSQEEIAAIRAELEKKMSAEEEKREALRVNMEQLQKERDEELRAERQRIHEQELAHKEAMWKHEAELASLQAKSKYETELIEAQFMNQMKEAELERYREEERKRNESCSVM